MDDLKDKKGPFLEEDDDTFAESAFGEVTGSVYGTSRLLKRHRDTRVYHGRKRSRELAAEAEEKEESEDEELQDEEESEEESEESEEESEESEESEDAAEQEGEESEDSVTTDEAETEGNDSGESSEKENKKQKRKEERERKKQKKQEKKEQKKLLRKRYAKEVREAKNVGEAKEVAGSVVERIVESVRNAFTGSRSKTTAAILMLILIFCFFLTDAAAGVGFVFIGAITGSSGGSFLSDADDLEACENYVKSMECSLQEDIANIEEDYPDYDEYSYAIGKIGHNPITLIAYLSMKDTGFTFESVKDELDALTGRMYELILDPISEERTRMVTKTVEVKKVRPVIKERIVTTYTVERDPHTGFPKLVPHTELVRFEDEEEYTETETTTEEEWYDAEILLVTLLSYSIEDIIKEDTELEILTEDDLSLYESYLSTKGGLQVVQSPIIGTWQDKISSMYGYRIHPISNERQFHSGVDIAVAEGTDVYAGFVGRVTESYFSESYGNVISVAGGNGITVRYAHLKERFVSVGEMVGPETIIAKSGNTGRSTGPHLHLEIRNGNDTFNPMFYVLEEREEY